MARITVEDCLEQIPNRFQLVLAATYRARMLSQGHTPRVESKNKPLVTALRESSILFAMLFGWLFFRDTMGPSKIWAGLVIVAGVILTRL